MKVFVVDLDDSLIKTDLLYESVFSLVKKNPFNVIVILKWYLTGGSLNLKLNIVKCVSPSVDFLPYRKEIIELIKEKKNAGYQTVIASASPKHWV